MRRIFVSYRRADAQGEANHLVADLRRRYGQNAVFIDITAIAPGADFATEIERAIADSAVCLVVIGNDWLARDDGDHRRLDDPADWVRLEIESALGHGLHVVPVLVQGADLPAPATLPASLAPLVARNAHEMSARRWDFDFGVLVQVLDSIVGYAPAVASGGAIRNSVIGTAAVSAALLGYWLFGREDALPQSTPEPPRAPSAFADSVEWRLFQRAAEDLESQHDVTDAEMARLAQYQVAACGQDPQGLVSSLARIGGRGATGQDSNATGQDSGACGAAASSTMQAAFESVCANKLRGGTAIARDNKTELIKGDITLLSCVQLLQSQLLNSMHDGALDAIRNIKAG